MKPETIVLLFAVSLVLGVMYFVSMSSPKKVTLNHELMLPMTYTNYSNGETWSFKTQDGMPCISYVANNRPGGLSCDWDWRDRDED